MADVEVDDEHEDEILGLPDEPRPIDPLACRPKFWKMFFAMQIVFVLFFLNSAFAPLARYACNPYSGLSWNDEKNGTFKEEPYCRGPRCWETQERCMENCLVYQNWLDQIQTGVEDGLDSPPRGTYPNPLCFHWETGNPTLNGGKDSSPRRKFEELKRRAEGLEWYRKSAFLCNIASFFALLFWVILCCSQYTGKYKLTSVLLFVITVVMYYAGNYFALQAIDTLQCFHPQNIFNLTMGEPIGSEMKSFCEDQVKVVQNGTNGMQTIKLISLPPMPKSWKASYILLGIRGTVPLVFLLIWACRKLFGPKFFQHTTMPAAEVAMRRTWEKAKRRIR